MADYYATLGVPRDASEQDIKSAFRRIARESHPDSNPGDVAAEERFRGAAEAYEVLSDQRRRAAYDRGDTIDLGDLFSSVGGVDDLLQRFFGGGFGGFAQTNRPSRGRDIAVTAVVTLADASTGTERAVTYPAAVACEVCDGSGGAPGSRPERCDRCQGSGSVRVSRQTILGATMTIAGCDRCAGRGSIITDPCGECRGRGSIAGERSITVDIPAGISDRDRLRVTGGGNAGGPGDQPGDLYVDVRVEVDSRFERHGPDLVHRVSIGLSEAALGTQITVPLVGADEGEPLEIAAGTQPGTVFRLPRLGLPRLGARGRGDMLVEVSVTVPSSLTAEQEAALRSYAEATDEQPRPPGRKKRKK